MTMNSKLVLAIMLMVLSCSATRYCEVEDSSVNIFVPNFDVQQIQLSKHFKGYNLDYESSNPEIVQVYEPYHVAEETPIDLKEGFMPLNVDSKNSRDNLWGRDGVVIAQGDSTNIAIGYGAFKNDVLPVISNITYFTLPKDGECYSGHIFDQSLSVVLDCESSTYDEDMLCLLRNDGSQKCSFYDPIAHTGKRINLVHSLDTNQYLFSAASTKNINPAFQNETFINIYHLTDSGADFNLIVDRRTLGLDSLSITDMAVMDLNAVTYIIVADASGKLIRFRYMPDNTIGDIHTLSVAGSPMSISISPYSEIIVGTADKLLVYSYSSQSGSFSLAKSYEVEPSDNSIVNIQSSINHITVRTASNNVYTYDRRFTALRYLLNKDNISQGTAIVVSPFYPRTFYINGTHMRSVALTSGYLYVGLITEDTNVTVTAMSGTATCKLNLILRKVEDPNKIYNKKDLKASYRFEN